MTTMDSVKSQVKNKKGKHWMYFSKHGKKSKSIEDPSTSTKPSGTDGTALPHQPGNHPSKAHLKKRKRKRKPRKPLGSSFKAEKDKQKVSNEGSSAFTFNKEVATKAVSERTDDCAGPDHAARGASNTSKAKQLRKKMKRKLKILKRKEMKKTMTESRGISSNEQDKLVTFSATKKSKRTSEQTKSYKTSGGIGDKELDRETSKEDKSRVTSKALSRKRIRKGELDTTETKKKKKKQGTNDTVDSGMSSGNDETPQLPEEPQDVASNWKALATKLKASAPRNPKPKIKNSNASDKAVEKKENEIWFDDVDPALLEAEKGSSEHNASDSAGAGAYQGDNKITKCVALDCEMVGIGHEGKESILARVSMVNEYGHCIYDKFVKPREKVTDFRTEFSGVRPKDLFKGNAEEFLTVQKEIADMIKDRILVGHALKNDMKVLFLGQPRKLIRDTASYPHFRELMKTKRPSLKKLAKTVLGVTVQEGEHNSVEDAQTAMRLYTLHRTAWEKSLKQRGKTIKK